MRNAPDAISEVDAAACYNKLDDQGQGFLKALVARSSKKTPSTSTIAEWADLVKRDVDTVKGALVHLRNQEKLEHHRKSHTPDAKELKPNIDWVMSHVPPAAPKGPRPVAAETHLPTPAVSVSPEPAPRVPSTLSSTAPAISPLTRPVPPPINTTFTVHPQSQPPSSASTSAPPTGTPLAGTSSGYSLPRLSFDYPTRLPPTGLHPTVSHYRPQTFLPNQTPTPYQLPSPVESRTTFLATAPPTAATPVPPTVKEQVSPPSQVVEYLHLGPAPMDIDPTPRPPPPRSIDAFLTQTDAYDALLEGIFDKTSRGELARWGLYPNMLPPSAEP
ncbi:hypothetical protein OF83DRAFT_144048 [Amylostereum chailletii]|nr:hypothetical protein OF83DRAFT_144048 [Amylostereum chailletii]